MPIMPQKPKNNEQQAIQYNLFRWGPCLVKLKISEENRKLFLSEGSASMNSYEKRLAGVLKKEVEFRDYKKFEKFFSDVFKLYADALRKWTGSKDENFEESYDLEALWCNFQGPGDFNPPHDHGGTLSWVIFLQIPEKLKYENSKYKGRSAGPGGLTFLYGDGPREAVTHHSFFPEEGDMFIFPAWLKHWVYPFVSNCERISVSGNVRDHVKIKNLKLFDRLEKKVDELKSKKEPALKGNN